MELDLPRLKRFFSKGKEWRYEKGVLRRRLKRSMYPKIIAAVLILVMTVTFVSYNLLKKQIIICDADEEISVSTFKATVEEVLDEKNIMVRPFDKLENSPTEKIKEGTKIEIKRARSAIVAVGGQERQIYTFADTVGEALEEAEIYLGIKDTVEPALEAELNCTDKITITRVEERISNQIEKIPFSNEIKLNEKLDKGLVRVIKKGQEGKKEIAEKIVFNDGKEALREVLWEKIIQNPVAAVLEQGTKDTFISSRGVSLKFTKAIEMVATAYDATFASTGKRPDHPQYGITRSGLKVRPGVVAVDPKVIPLGTHLYVEGYGESIAADTGGEIKGNRNDLNNESTQDVAKYGKKRIKVYVLDKPRYKF